MAFVNKHVFTAQLPYEDDQAETAFLVERFSQVNCYFMSLGQMSRLPPSELHTYSQGKLINKRIFFKNNLQARGLKLYFYTIPIALTHVVIDFLKALKTINFKCDIFFAQHFVPAYLAIILRKIGLLRCPTIIFYMFDFFFIPPEFPRGLYYRGIDRIHGYIRKHTDEIWFTTPRLAECVREHFGPAKPYVTEHITEGIFFKRHNKMMEPPSVPPLQLAFLGSLRPNNAVYESLDSIKRCLDLGMKIKLHIVGSGPEEERMKKYVTKHHLNPSVKFYGFENRGQEITKIFSKCHLGLALYNSDPYGPNWFLTSGKYRRFVSLGLPIITTSVPYFSKNIFEYQAGVVVDNNPFLVAQVLRRIYSHPRLIKKMRKGINQLYTNYTTDKVFSKAFGYKL